MSAPALLSGWDRQTFPEASKEPFIVAVARARRLLIRALKVAPRDQKWVLDLNETYVETGASAFLAEAKLLRDPQSVLDAVDAFVFDDNVLLDRVYGFQSANIWDSRDQFRQKIRAAFGSSDWYIHFVGAFANDLVLTRVIREALTESDGVPCAAPEPETASVSSPAVGAIPEVQPSAGDRVDVGSSTAPKPTEQDTKAAEVARRRRLLDEYKRATRTKSNSSIYQNRASGVHKPQFYQWRNGVLPSTSAMTMTLERFLAGVPTTNR